MQVDSVTCYCRVDSSLKTVSGARKFVPGSKLCMQPDIKPHAHKSKNSRKERNRTHAPLLPGLPDDLAIACLIRVPRVEHRKLRLVCKRWHHLLAGNYFFSLRKNMGMAEEWVYVIKRDHDGKILFMPLIPSISYGSHFPQFLESILKRADLVVLYLVVVTFTYLEEEIHSDDP